MPPFPLDDELDDEVFVKNDLLEQKVKLPQKMKKRKFVNEPSIEILDVSENSKWIYNLLMVGLIALFVTIPLFYIVISNRPSIHSISGMSKRRDAKGLISLHLRFIIIMTLFLIWPYLRIPNYLLELIVQVDIR